ncbi:TatD family hydrolase [Fangia hongkongensis]|uniref:TatD family hydrolase n=1 Tax=Fangia hongkongensis TaxID=270495 RepID=UPI00037F1636|nr:TatD family hydrolase [Fangia hongkongensis]MBK2124474.1 TatD family hydrolase [Fangia hongkongensis]
MLIDSHCHLNHLKLEDKTLSDVIAEAYEKGVKEIISISTTLEEVKDIAEIAKAHTGVFYSVGVHPSEFDGVQPQEAKEIISFARDNRCVAIGETGLDYYYNDQSTIPLQKGKFLAHLEAANRLQKPVIVHTRGAKKDTLELLKEGNIEGCGGVLHCFTEDWDMAKSALDMGMYISFSGIVTFKNAQSVQEVAKKIPQDRILVETDAPYLTPVPYRGKPNYPAYVYYVAEYLAELRKENFDAFASKTTENVHRLFNLHDA